MAAGQDLVEQFHEQGICHIQQVLDEEQVRACPRTRTIRPLRMHSLCSALFAKVSLLFSTLYENCPHYVELYVQSVLIMLCFICKVSSLCCVLYAKCPHYVVFCMQSVLIVLCFICKVSSLCCVLYAKCKVSSLYCALGGGALLAAERGG